MYIWSYRNEGAHFMRWLLIKILDDLGSASNSRLMRLKAISNVRGDVYTIIIAEHKQKNWTPKAKVDLQHLG